MTTDVASTLRGCVMAMMTAMTTATRETVHVTTTNSSVRTPVVVSLGGGSVIDSMIEETTATRGTVPVTHGSSNVTTLADVYMPTIINVMDITTVGTGVMSGTVLATIVSSCVTRGVTRLRNV